MMELKQSAWESRKSCLADETCPELQSKQSQNFTECLEGECHTFTIHFMHVFLMLLWLLHVLHALGFAGDYPCKNIHLLHFLNFDDLGYPE